MLRDSIRPCISGPDLRVARRGSSQQSVAFSFRGSISAAMAVENGMENANVLLSCVPQSSPKRPALILQCCSRLEPDYSARYSPLSLTKYSILSCPVLSYPERLYMHMYTCTCVPIYIRSRIMLAQLNRGHRSDSQPVQALASSPHHIASRNASLIISESRQT